MDGEAAVFHVSNGNVLIETFRQGPLHLDLGAKDRIGVAEAFRKVVQEITHGTSSSVE